METPIGDHAPMGGDGMTTGEEAEVAGEAVIEREMVGGEDRTPGHTPVVGAEDISPMANRYHPIGGCDRAKPKERNPKVDRDATTVVALPTLGESVLIMNVGTVAGEDTISVYVLGLESITLAGRRACTAQSRHSLWTRWSDQTRVMYFRGWWGRSMEELESGRYSWEQTPRYV